MKRQFIGKLGAYYALTKPGIIRGNLITAAAGFFLASNRVVDWRLLTALFAGLALIIASGCVFNNYLDRKIDRKMKRTRNRATVTGLVSPWAALSFGSLLGIAGSLVLGIYTNVLTLLVALLGLYFYVVVYGYAKRRNHFGTLVGSISGAVPPVVGYCAVTARLDLVALILFIILVFWQMPHFYAIAIFRRHEYKSAGIPVLPLEKGMAYTKRHILIYIVLFILAGIGLYAVDAAGVVYLAAVLLLGARWLKLALTGMRMASEEDSDRWARKVFGHSLITLTGLSLVIALSPFLP